jgi:putative nucleotidyltransferase with HDIG domain
VAVDTEQLIDRAIEEMPMISPVVNKLAEMARDLETAPRDIVKVIMIDPVLSGKVIKLVNSSFFGMKEKIQSLAQAVILLGVNTVKNMAMTTAVLDQFFVQSKQAPIQPEEFWKHCLATALVSKMIARQNQVPQSEEEAYFLAGLLHDLGKVVLVKSIPQIYAKCITESREQDVSLTFSERAHLGRTHNEVGAILAEKWRLDPAMQLVIANHHAEQGVPQEAMVRTVMVANNIVKSFQAGDGGDPVYEEMASDFMPELRIDEAFLGETRDKLPEELQKAVQFLKAAA